MNKLAIILSHPVQYYSPLFAVLSKEIELKVFYAFEPDALQQGKEGFSKAFQWDIDLLSGYSYEFVTNIAERPSSAYYRGCDTPGLGESLKEYGATHIVSFGWHLKMYRQALHYAKRNKIPIAVRGDSQLNPQLPWWKKFIKKLYYPFFLNQFDAFLSVGKRNKAYLRYYGVPERKIIFSPHAINQAFWKVQRKKENSSFIFVWVAKFIPKKRPLDVIRAFKLLVTEDVGLKDRVVLHMIGSGDLLEKAKKEVKDCKQIEFLGFKNQTELKEIYVNADCIILSSDYGETWGLVVNEAFAAGVPALVSNACGCSADLIDGKSGLSFEMGNIRSLKRAMLKVMDLISTQPQQINERIDVMNHAYSFSAIIQSFKQFVTDEII